MEENLIEYVAIMFAWAAQARMNNGRVHHRDKIDCVIRMRTREDEKQEWTVQSVKMFLSIPL